ncbi:hypothetical protein, partial [Flavobacterium sp.]|uniref:hypothetical protein n=1 Tax=Flavobacterium sp. TaxID=239 RepID=UPI0031D2078D
LEPWRRLPVDRLAICSITALAPLLAQGIASVLRVQMYNNIPFLTSFFLSFFSFFLSFFKTTSQSNK